MSQSCSIDVNICLYVLYEWIENNKSEAFTAVMSSISLYNSVACHDTHTHTAVHVYTGTHIHCLARTDYVFITNLGSSRTYDNQVTSLVKDGRGEKVKMRSLKGKKYKYIYIYIRIYLILKRSTPLHLCSCRVPSPLPNKPKTLWQSLPKWALR